MGNLPTNTFEGGTDGANITVNNSGGSSGNAFGVIVYNNAVISSTSGNANVIYSTAAAINGSLGCQVTRAASGSYLRHDLSETTGNTRIVGRRPLWWDALPSTGTMITSFNSAGAFVGYLLIESTGRLTPYLGTIAYTTGRSTWAYTPGQKVWIEYAYLLETGAGGNGQVAYRITNSAGTLLEEYTSPATLPTGTTAAITARYVIPSNTIVSGVDRLDDLAVQFLDSGWIGTLANSAVINKTTTTSVAADFRTSTGAAPLSFSIGYSSGANLLAQVIEPVEGLFIIPMHSTTASVYTVNVTDNNGSTATTTVNVPAQTASATPSDALRIRTRAGGALI